MKRLTLVRHAKASRDDPALPDIARPLTERGRRDAGRMGRRMAKRNARPDLLVASPAVRARQTALLIAEELFTTVADVATDQRLYGGDIDGLLEVIRELDDHIEHVMLFGHNPEMSDLLRRLSDVTEEDLPTCGIAELTFSASGWGKIGRNPPVEVSLDSPKGHEDSG